MAKSRKSARQRRRHQRPTARPGQPRPIATPGATQAPLGDASASAAETTTATATATTRSSSTPAARRGSRANPRLTVAGPSRLSDRAIEEYHYVGRDLRNIARLIVVMAVLLVIAFVAFTALGVGTTA